MQHLTSKTSHGAVEALGRLLGAHATLTRQVRLSPSGITRMLDRLEVTGLVEKGQCEKDARVTYAVLTDAGMNKLRECAPAHFEAVERLIGGRLSDEEVASLSKLLGRLSDLDDDCSVGD